MPDPLSSADLERLLSHRSWLRRLVVRLVGESDADDVLQETWLRALKTRPRNPRRWLATVARNFALRARDRASRARDRDRRAACDDVVRAPDEVLAELEAQHAVTRIVAQLPEPYRSALLWRYFDGLAIARIAARRGVAESTVRTWLSRALERIRIRLRQEYGDEWRARVALPLLPGSAAALAHGALAMIAGTSTKILMGTAAAGLIACLFFLWPGRGPDPGTGPDPGDSGTSRPAALESARDPDAAEIERQPVASAETTEAREESAARITGQVLDDRGRPLAGVPLHAIGASWGPNPSLERVEPTGEPLGVSTADGTFALPAVDEPCDVVAGAGFVTLRAAPVDPATPDRPNRFLIAAPAVEFAGIVVDDSGLPVPEVRVFVAADLLGRFPGSLEDTTTAGIPGTTTDADGHFRLAAAPGTDQAWLQFQEAGYEIVRWRCRPESVFDLRIELRRIASDGSELVAQVLDPAGRPVAGAHVCYSGEQAETDEAGVVRLPWQRFGRLDVSAPGYQPLLTEYMNQKVWRELGSPVPMILQLPGPPLTITGMLLGADGRGADGFGLTIADAIMLGINGRRCAEQIAADVGEHSLDWERTGDGGRFTLGGLRDADYRLRFFDPKTLLSITTEPIRAGTPGVVVRIPYAALRRPFRGRVTARDGQALAGIEVQLMNQVAQTPDAQLRSSAVRTDAEGFFELPVGPRHEGWIVLTGDAIAPTTQDLASYADSDPVVLVVPRKCRVRIVPSGQSVDAEYIMPLDAEGRPVQMLVLSRSHPRPVSFWRPDGDPSPELTVPETVTHIGYFRAGKLLRKKAVKLDPGRLNEIVP